MSELYQMIIMHEAHNRTTEELPTFNMGRLSKKNAEHLASYLEGAVQTRNMVGYHGPVESVVDAWARQDYRCWLVPPYEDEPIFEMTASGIVQVPTEEDPR